MRIQTILNRVEKFKSFVYGAASLEEGANGPALVVQIRPRKNGRPRCSGCGRPGIAYDRLEERRFEFVPLLGVTGRFKTSHLWALQNQPPFLG
jgi:transposase